MEKYKKIILIIAIIVIIIAIACIILLIVLDKKQEEEGTIKVNEDGSVEFFEEGDLGIEFKQKQLKEPTAFFSVENAIQKYVNSNFTAISMNELSGERIISYAVYGQIEENDIFFIVRVDIYNLTCEIEQLNSKDYNDINQIVLEDNQTEIANNGNNTFEYKRVSNEDMCSKYLKDFSEMEINDTQKAYSMLDEEYRGERFPTFEDFEEYVSLCREIIQNSALSSYNVEYYDDYTEYIFTDNYNNYYTVKTDGVAEYTICLDSYTIKSDNYEEEYNKLSDENKVNSNVYTFLQMINTKDFSHAYELLDETFKNNNFNNLDSFKEYVNTNFFNINFNVEETAEINSENGIYTYETTIRSGAGSSAQSKNLTVIMQLGEGTEFVMSFSIN